jgi:pyruvate formate lyase activating enzyme
VGETTPPRGRVFDLSTACFEDGPGLRTVVFFKGCALRCPWCHNPEGRSPAPEIALDPARCIGCGQCQEVCERHWPAPHAWREGCTTCGRCVEVCPSTARRLLGRELSVDELVQQVLVDRDFFAGTGGGVTFSGGEPLQQPQFLLACAAALRREGVSVAVETAGFWPARWCDPLGDAVDLVLFDLKHVDPERCRDFLGQPPYAALANLISLRRQGAPLEIRITLVPGFNDTDADLEALGRWLARHLPEVPVRVQPFHRMAEAKQCLLDRPYRYGAKPPTNVRRLGHARQLLARQGVQTA